MLLARANDALKKYVDEDVTSLTKAIEECLGQREILTLGDFLKTFTGEVDLYSDEEETESVTLVWNFNEVSITEYGYCKYNQALSAPILRQAKHGLFLGCPAEPIEMFTYAAAGYISDLESKKVFRENYID
jgi:hypothetical protein